jgi:hypothetical protein
MLVFISTYTHLKDDGPIAVKLLRRFGVRKGILTAAACALAVTVLVLAVALPAGAAHQSGSGSFSTLSASCGVSAPNLENLRVNDAASNGAANQRSGSFISCGAVGVLQPTDDALYFCYTDTAANRSSWTYLRNLRTGVQGWVRDDLLQNSGSHRNCGF